MIKRYFLYLLFIFGSITCLAQKGALDLSFNPGTGIMGNSNSPGTAYAVALQPDGKIIIGGEFTTYNGDTTTIMARLFTDGKLDTTFKVQVETHWQIQTIAVQPDGKIIAGGSFAVFDSVVAGNIIRLNTDGSADTTFKTGAGFNSEVRRVVIQPDGKILVGGYFTAYNNIPYGYIARLNTDGGADTSFYANPGASSTVEAIVVQPDNKILIAGDFDSYDNDTLFRLARLNPDGTGDVSYNRLGGFDRVIYSMALNSDTSVMLAGSFTSFNFEPEASIVRMSPECNLITTFQSGAGANNEVDDVKLADNNQILISGNFSAYGGKPFSGIASLDTLGRPDTTFNSAEGINVPIYKMAIQPDGKIIIAGGFSIYNGVSRNGVARLYNCNTPQPGPISGDTMFSCPGTHLTFSISPVAGALNYIWSLPTGWVGNSDSASIQVIAGDTGGVVSVIAFGDSCGNSLPQTLNVQRQKISSVPVCEVTVDSQSLYNIIIWDKPATGAIDSFFIYRQDTAFVFTKIAAVPYDSFSEYDDTDAAANPNATAHQYKISVLDTCGVESALSDYHSTIFLQDLGNGNLLWAPYEIENGVNPVTYYRVYRDTAGNGDFVPLNTAIPGGNTSFTDVGAAAYPDAHYVLDVAWDISCNPTRALSTSRSNIKHTSKSLNRVAQVLPEADFTLSPNPAAQTVTVSYPALANVVSIDIENVVGEKVISLPFTANLYNSQSKQINIASLAKGIYMVSISTNTGRIVKKLVVQ